MTARRALTSGTRSEPRVATPPLGGERHGEQGIGCSGRTGRGMSRKQRTEQRMGTSEHRARIIGHVWTVILFCALVAAFAAYPQQAHAKYDPAPRSVVAAGLSRKAPPKGTTERRAWIICRIFGKHRCVGALNVAWCESGLNERSRGPNDEYGNPRQGIWQFGTWERKRFGYGRNAWQQTRAAKAYHSLSWWGPWECEPA